MSDPEAFHLSVIDETTIKHGRAFNFVELTLRDDEGVTHTRQIVRHKGAATILALLDTENGSRVLFVRNERHAVGARMDELPAGGIEEGETPEQTARRELREETGYEAGCLEPIARFHTTPGITDELMHAFVARDLTHVGQDLDDGEHLSVHQWTVERSLDAVRNGGLTDAKTMLTLLLAEDRGIL